MDSEILKSIATYVIIPLVLGTGAACYKCHHTNSKNSRAIEDVIEGAIRFETGFNVDLSPYEESEPPDYMLDMTRTPYNSPNEAHMDLPYTVRNTQLVTVPDRGEASLSFDVSVESGHLVVNHQGHHYSIDISREDPIEEIPVSDISPEDFNISEDDIELLKTTSSPSSSKDIEKLLEHRSRLSLGPILEDDEEDEDDLSVLSRSTDYSDRFITLEEFFSSKGD